jgi:hypothetical protein
MVQNEKKMTLAPSDPPGMKKRYAGDVNPRSDTSECLGESCLL